ncbi:unnamed protein product [Schistosoma turkestanicum]|nr:unnamed protein product [Schistosoma turkestanicum]
MMNADFNSNAHHNTTDSQTKSSSSSTPDTRSIMNSKQNNQSMKQIRNSSSSLNDSIRKRLTNNLSIENDNNTNHVNKNILHSTLNHASPRISPKNQLTETKSMISSSNSDRQNYKEKNNVTIKRELLLTDRRMNRIRNLIVSSSSKRINQHSSLNITNSTQSSSDHSDVDIKKDNKDNTVSLSKSNNNCSFSNRSSLIGAIINSSNANSKDIDQLDNSDSSSVSDIASVTETGRIPMPTPRRTYSNEINQTSLKSGICHSRLLKRGQINNTQPQNSINNNRKVPMSKPNPILTTEQQDEIIPLNMNILLNKPVVHSSRSNKTPLYKNLLSPSLNSVMNNYKTITNGNGNHCTLK